MADSKHDEGLGNSWGLKCPECENTVEFSVGGYASIVIHGSELTGDDFDWDADNSMSCGVCGHDGIADDFDA